MSVPKHSSSMTYQEYRLKYPHRLSFADFIRKSLLRFLESILSYNENLMSVEIIKSEKIYICCNRLSDNVVKSLAHVMEFCVDQEWTSESDEHTLSWLLLKTGLDFVTMVINRICSTRVATINILWSLKLFWAIVLPNSFNSQKSFVSANMPADINDLLLRHNNEFRTN